MAAKTFEEWFEALKVLRDDPKEDEFRACWNLATKLSEEKFASTNTDSVPCRLWEDDNSNCPLVPQEMCKHIRCMVTRKQYAV
jgi:hypothetical protein